MEYVYTALLLHKAGQKVTEDTVKKVLTAAGTKPDEARIKALVASLEGVNIDEAIKSAAVATVAAAPAAAAGAAHAGADKAAEKKAEEEAKKKEEEAVAGLGALFG
ncbi:MAG TPA: 50S ribosomal protein P1 [Candidatus Nanoarchaeia archaeon]|nr:50S ribosomal protein P1 [Candidatus Nanoarchaeia archaeon]